jgi:nucleotide-binding universal stress UspA family protein
VRTAMGAATSHPSTSWYEIERPDQETLASRGRAFSLIVVGRPVVGRFAPSMVALEGALFESGRPLLIAPPTAPKAIGRSIAIAWNGSTETARTVGFAMPLLHEAEEVIVVSVEEGMVPGPTGKDIAQHLVRAGIPARTRHVLRKGRQIGEAMLAESQDADADLVVKGAYTHSRLRQMIFGGATSYILGNTTMPVFMAH